MSPSQEKAIIALRKLIDDADCCRLSLDELAEKARGFGDYGHYPSLD